MEKRKWLVIVRNGVLVALLALGAVVATEGRQPLDATLRDVLAHVEAALKLFGL